MYREQDKQTSFFGTLVYERIVPPDHFLRQLNSVIDLSFVNELCKELYCPDNGRPCWEPQLLFKVLLLQYLYDLSDAVIEEEIRDRISFKWFLNLDTDDMPPDATTLVRFRDRVGPGRFAEIFNRIVACARAHNLINDRLHVIDATAVKAKVDTWRIRNRHDRDHTDDDSGGSNNVSPGKPARKDYIEKNSPDKDARIGHCSANKTVFGYKSFIDMDKDSEIIVAATTAPANEQEATFLEQLVTNPAAGVPRMLTADKAYDTMHNHSLLETRGTVSGILKRRIRRKDKQGNYYFDHRQTKEHQSFLARLRSVVEHKIAEMKRWHHLYQARFLGLRKVTQQTFLTCIAVNLKRMVALLSRAISPPGCVQDCVA